VLSRLVTRPVSRLAAEVSALRPDREGILLRAQFDDHEIGLIAEAIDGYQVRIRRLVERERNFTDDASHELRTPLAVILSAMPLLEEEHALSAPGRERLERIARAARQMHAMIEALLFLAREDGGWRAEPCALEDVVEDLARTWHRAAEDKGLTLICEVDEPQVIAAPPGIAACVIGNLLANAVQHTQDGQVRIALRGKEILIEDSGPGIPLSDRQRIFERRYRGTRSAGMGIGLHLVQRICERLGWSIKVDTAAGGGTRFTVHAGAGEATKS
jgi:signal transduction histidine kinase